MNLQCCAVSILLILSQCLLEATCFMDRLYSGIDANRGIRERFKVTNMVKKLLGNTESTDVDYPSTYDSGVPQPLKRGYDSIYEVAEPREVGFHASLSSSITVTGRDRTIKFDNIHEAIPDNSVYEGNTGTFYSPVSGTYMVSFSLATQADRDILASVYVRRNGRKRSSKRLTVVTNGRKGTSQGSITGFVSLNTGDELYAAVDWPSTADVFGNNLTSLSVYLLQKH